MIDETAIRQGSDMSGTSEQGHELGLTHLNDLSVA
jgi:hypothetical protein